jgi:hypothetical protein
MMGRSSSRRPRRTPAPSDQRKARQFISRNQSAPNLSKAIHYARRKPYCVGYTHHHSVVGLPICSHPRSVQQQSSVDRLIYVVRVLALN